MASVVVDKFAWHSPLYRQAQIMKLLGLLVDRSTLAAKLHEIDPQTYLADILNKLVNGWPARKPD